MPRREFLRGIALRRRLLRANEIKISSKPISPDKLSNDPRIEYGSPVFVRAAKAVESYRGLSWVFGRAVRNPDGSVTVKITHQAKPDGDYEKSTAIYGFKIPVQNLGQFHFYLFSVKGRKIR